jgi:hypothetical protein
VSRSIIAAAEPGSPIYGCQTGHAAPSPPFAVEQRHEGLLKLFFADVLTTEEAIELVAAMRCRHELIRAGIEQATPPNRPDRRFGHIVRGTGSGSTAG